MYTRLALLPLCVLAVSPIRAMQVVLPKEETAVYEKCFATTHPAYGGISYFDTKPDASSDHPTILFIPHARKPGAF